MGVLSTTLQAAHQLSLIDTCTRISLSDHLMLLWKMQRGLTGTGNTLGRFDNEDQESTCVWQCVRRVGRGVSGRPEVRAPVKQPEDTTGAELPSSSHHQKKPQDREIPRRGSSGNAVWPPQPSLCC